MAERVPLGDAIIWFRGTEAQQDQQAEEMAFPTEEQRELAQLEWREIRDRYTWLLDAQPSVDMEEEEINIDV